MQTVRISLCLALLWMTSPITWAIDFVQVEPGPDGVVVCESALASRVGRETLRQGGNAVDAAVSTAFALAVTWPEAGNLGGGGFMLVRPSGGKDPVCVDYREVAPRAMNATSFNGQDTPHSQKAVGVPGTVQGLAEAHRLYGSLPWKDLVSPAMKLAQQGFLVDQFLAASLNHVLKKKDVQIEDSYAELRRVYGRYDERSWQAGDRLRLPDLAKTLADIADLGAPGFYAGRSAELLVEEMQRGDGVITLDDLSRYEAKVRPVIRGTYRGYTVIGAPPPSSGGTCVIQALNILENFDLSARERFDPQTVHLMAETSRRVFADRARHLGDPGFVEIPRHLLTKEYAKELSQSIDLEKASSSQSVAPEIKLTEESPSTTHFSIVDGQGMAVSNTYTLEASWGSRIVVRGAGYLLNNEMGDFNWFPGVTNRSGRIGTPANQIEAGKRMLSSQSPSMLEHDGQLVLVTGSPGGRTIINTVVGMIVNMVDFNMSAAEAVAAPRMHHQWFPNRIELETLARKPHSIVNVPLRRMGHVVKNRSSQGSAHSIGIDPDTGIPVGVSDFRRGGQPSAFHPGTFARWDFSDPPKTELSKTSGWGDFHWTDDIAGSATDGTDHFRIRRNSLIDPMQSYLDLRSSELKNVAMELRIESAQFAGPKPNEQLRLTFAHGTVIPRVTARLVFGRISKNEIIVRGEASAGGSPILPVVLSRKPKLERPIVLRLEVDSETDTYRIGSREVTEQEFTWHGKGKLAAERELNYFGLNALNDFAAEGEFLDIDRLELQTSTTELPPKRSAPVDR